MDTFFSISQGYTTEIRPPLSHKVRDYMTDFLTENLLKEKKILIGSKWHINLTISFVGEGRLGLPKDITFINSPRTVSSENTKLYEVLIPVKLLHGSEYSQLKLIELFYEALILFFTTLYKKITKELMDNLWKKIDLTYLLSLPYPAPPEEQKYIGDVKQPDGTIINLIPKFN